MTPGDLARPADVRLDRDFAAWFEHLADHLLNKTDLLVAGERLRIAEVEFYYHGSLHPDPFAHRDPVQVHAGRWYFHRTGGVLRGGSYKGLDLTFGELGVYAGALIRTLVAPDGTRVSGPSKCVDHLIQRTGRRNLAELDESIGARLAWDVDCPLQLVPAARNDPRFATARVGLTLKRARVNPSMPFYLVRSYRFLTEPRLRKGRTHLLLALIAQGMAFDEIQALTGCMRHSLRHLAQDFALGREGIDLTAHMGDSLRPAALARLHGWWSTR